jgi:hypothetical protein
VGIFSRRRKDQDPPEEPESSAEALPEPAETTDAAPAEPLADAPDPEEGPVPEVGISVSTYGAPPPADAIPGLRDNAVLRDTLARTSRPPTATDVVNAARQVLQGHVFLRVKGDARALLSQGDELPLSVARHGDDTVMLVYSSGAALRAAVQADGDTGTSAVAQPALAVVRQALAGPYAGIVLDHASAPATVFLPRAILERAVEHADDGLAIKSLLVGSRGDATASAVVAALATSPLWLAARRTDEGQMGIAEVRDGNGTRRLEAFSHPLEVLALGRGDQPVPVTAEQLGALLRAEEAITALIVDPAGPWIELTRADLAPLIPA